MHLAFFNPDNFSGKTSNKSANQTLKIRALAKALMIIMIIDILYVSAQL